MDAPAGVTQEEGLLRTNTVSIFDMYDPRILRQYAGGLKILHSTRILYIVPVENTAHPVKQFVARVLTTMEDDYITSTKYE